MPCYNLLLVTTPRASKLDVLTTFRKIGKEIVDRGGVIRGFKNLGIRHLPQKMRRHGQICNEARYITIKKDEMRRLKYNAKRKALDQNKKENLY